MIVQHDHRGLDRRADRHRAAALWSGTKTAALLAGLAGLFVSVGSMFGPTGLAIGAGLGIATAISALANLVMWLPFLGYHDDDEAGANPLGLLVAAIIAPIAATVVHLAISRTREYDADREAARLLGDGRPLARALARIERAAAAMPMAIPPAQAAHYIVNPLAGGGIAALFSTHPPVQARIERLLDLAR